MTTRKLEELDAEMDPDALAEAKRRGAAMVVAYEAWLEEQRTENFAEPGEEVGADQAPET